MLKKFKQLIATAMIACAFFTFCATCRTVSAAETPSEVPTITDEYEYEVMPLDDGPFPEHIKK